MSRPTQADAPGKTPARAIATEPPRRLAIGCMELLAASTAVWVFILVPVIVAWVAGLVDILRRDLPRATKAAWVLIVVLLPIVGTVAYFLMRKPTDKEVRQAQQAAAARRTDWPTGTGPRPPGS